MECTNCYTQTASHTILHIWGKKIVRITHMVLFFPPSKILFKKTPKYYTIYNLSVMIFFVGF